MLHDDPEIVNDDSDLGDRAPVGGRVLISRCLIDHDFVGFGSEGRYSHSEAWIDLIQMASFKPRAVTVRNKAYTLDRGQLVASERFLAQRWNWTRKKLRVFMQKLGAKEMVKKGPSQGPNICVITICNYEKFQTQPAQQGPSKGPTTREKRAQIREKKLTRKEDSRLELSNDSSLSPAPQTTGGCEPEAPLPWVAEFDRLNGVEPAAKAQPQEAAPKANSAPVAAIDAGFEAWARVAKDFSLPACKSISDKRRKSMGARIKAAGGVEAFEATLRLEISRSPFLRGKVKPAPGRKQFRLDIEFVLSPSGWDKIVDGRYADDKASPALPPISVEYANETAAERLARRARERAEGLAQLRESEAFSGRSIVPVGKAKVDSNGVSRASYESRGRDGNENA